MLDGLDLFWRTRSLIDIDALAASKPGQLVLPFIREWAESARGVSGVEVFAGFERIQEFAQKADAAMQAHDFLLMPTSPATAFPAEWASPSQDPLRPFPHIGFTVAFNMSGQPALSINGGFSPRGCPWACKSSGGGSTISASCVSPAPSRTSAPPKCGPGRSRRSSAAARVLLIPA